MAGVYGYRKYCLCFGALFLLGAGASHGAASKHAINDSTQQDIEHLLVDQEIEDSEAIKGIFERGDNALPTLVKALQEGKSLERASAALAYLGGIKERQFLQNLAEKENDPRKKWLIASFLAGALVEPASHSEWNFLETCLKNYKEQEAAFASFSAALALGVNGSPEALRLLESIRESAIKSANSGNDTVDEVSEAIRWIKKRSRTPATVRPTERVSDSEQIKQTVLENTFFTETDRERSSVENVAFTRNKTRALVSIELYRGVKDAQGYDVVLERRSGTWRIIGVWFSWVA